MLWKIAGSTKKPFSTSHLAPLVVLIYLIAVWFNLLPLIAIAGLLLWGFIPGFYVVQCIRVPKISLAGELILGSALSFGITVLSLVMVRTSIPFTEYAQTGFVLGLNLVIWVGYLIYNHYYPETEREITGEELFILGIALIPLLMFIVRSVLNPYLVDQDGATYVTVMEEIKRTHFDSSFLGLRRAAFTNAVMSLNYLTHIDFLSILKFVLPGYIWFVLSLPFALLTNLRRQKWFPMIGLLFLSSAALISGVDRVKPEILVFLLWFPTVLFFYWSITTRRLLFYVIGLVFAYLSFRSHDTGAITFLAYLLATVVGVIILYKELRPAITVKNVLLAVVIILPYLKILPLTDLLASFRETFHSLPFSTQGIHFHWWFLNDYQSGGVLAGWPGWLFILFYIFNGVGILLFLFLALKKLIGHIRQKSDLLALTLPIISLVIYFSVSEILPRFGFFFLPDRAWVHFFYDAAILTLLALCLVEPKFARLPAWSRYLGWLSLSGGIAIAFLLTTVLGSVVSSSETAGIAQISNLPPNAVILSTQPFNNILVDVYGQHKFIPVTLPPPNQADAPQDSTAVKSYLNTAIDAGRIIYQQRDSRTVDRQVIETVTETKDNGILVTHNVTVLSDVQTSELSQALIDTTTPVYLFYSFAKTDGLQARLGRASWVSGIDLSHRSLFNAITLPVAIYRDKATVLLRIR